MGSSCKIFLPRTVEGVGSGKWVRALARIMESTWAWICLDAGCGVGVGSVVACWFELSNDDDIVRILWLLMANDAVDEDISDVVKTSKETYIMVV